MEVVAFVSRFNVCIAANNTGALFIVSLYRISPPPVLAEVERKGIKKTRQENKKTSEEKIRIFIRGRDFN